MSLALVLGGGAPNMTIMSGALVALDERGVTFDVVSTSGAGMFIGLLYAAPKGGNRQDALRSTQSMAVSDFINRLFPTNFKVFQKSGPFASAYRAATQPWLNLLPTQTPSQRLLRDSFEFLNAAWCPSDINPWAVGLCDPAPWIEDVVDFEKLRDFAGELYISAYNITRHEQQTFDKEEITADHFRAGLSMPFIYPPFKLNGEYYIEGCILETLNYRALQEREGAPIDRTVVFDVIGHDKIIQHPRSLYEALSQLIMVPLTRLAKHDTNQFLNQSGQKDGVGEEVLKLGFEDLIPEDYWQEVLHWSHSNMTYLFDIGYRAGTRFFERNEAALTSKTSATVTPLHEHQYKMAA